MTGLLVLGLLIALAVLAPVFGADTRDGRDWRRSPVTLDERHVRGFHRAKVPVAGVAAPAGPNGTVERSYRTRVPVAGEGVGAGGARGGGPGAGGRRAVPGGRPAPCPAGAAEAVGGSA